MCLRPAAVANVMCQAFRYCKVPHWDMNLRQVKLKAKELLTFYHQCHNAKLDHKKLENEEFKMCIRGYHQSQPFDRQRTGSLAIVQVTTQWIVWIWT
uniref:Uncharacterized protein n=1 Tax=Gibberella zeae (strain ATCC MYA-4620 / CBS 123657 / FGSC 9075 / NRRL 31084 / PH-1) TaxID=229533 RepID=A0A098DG92_GIBZE